MCSSHFLVDCLVSADVTAMLPAAIFPAALFAADMFATVRFATALVAVSELLCLISTKHLRLNINQ
ncbi:hypothetical protein HC752_04145 [Vibrio sp. S9_S30]|uniref:hypothetical protein n=1 Tax=Vibrio sp. S9_S30 TaxID=2720226 RepID=UPI0016815AB4|nr:hypothetical protein [Vibrio sp. S9_S30]MBD1556118.1 hypothetical protein [Vibrio sp. S9_S30]